MALPSKPSIPKLSPKILMLYAPPKTGKTDALSRLPECLIINFDVGGTDPYAVLTEDCSVKATDGATYHEQCLKAFEKFMGIKNDIVTFAKTNKRIPYTYICLDSVTNMVDLCAASALEDYYKEDEREKRAKSMVSNIRKELLDIRDLPHGAGHGRLREKVVDIINTFSSISYRLILTTHVKDKLLNEVGKLVSDDEIALEGKLGTIVASNCQAIGKLHYRTSPADQAGVWVTFIANPLSTKGSGSSYPHLRGKDFKLDWRLIYPDGLTSEEIIAYFTPKPAEQ